MNHTTSQTSARSLWQRLRPFVRRDLKGRLISASIAALVIAGLSWFGISAFTQLDSEGAKDARVQLGLEHDGTVCSPSAAMSDCSFDDRVQAVTDEQWSRDLRIRSAINHELLLRVAATRENLSEAKDLLERQAFDFGNGRVAGGDMRLAELLRLPDIAPLHWREFYANGVELQSVLEAATYEPVRDGNPEGTRTLLLAAIETAQRHLDAHERVLHRQASRDGVTLASRAALDREATRLALVLHRDRYDIGISSQAWLETGVAADLDRTTFRLANDYAPEFAAALSPRDPVWDGGWDETVWTKRHKPTVRYHSPIDTRTRNRLAGTLFLAIAAFIFTVIAPVVTATATAREREAGTLPVLRMTGMSAGDLALAMIIGPNVFALTLGGSLLLAAIVLLGTSVGLCALLLPLTLLALLATATHLTAIGLGDALGQRVNAMVVGGLLGIGVLVPGLLGTALTSFDIAATGLLLGPLPPLLANVADLAELRGVGLYLGNELTLTMLTYSVAIQAALGLICLASWRRRVEQGWAPLFRPIEGVALALASIGCSALTLLDINAHHQAQNFDALNLLTFLSSAFLLPVLAWLLVASLRRPARARAVADYTEARRAFWRFQGFLVVTGVLVGLTYHLVMDSAGLATDDSEVMWATLSQLLLAAETAVATLLWASRRRDGKLRVAFLGGTVVLTQLAAVFGTYGLEVEHVALTNGAASPLLLNAQVSPYWLGFLILCWSAGLALIFTALLRRRDERLAEEAAAQEFDDDIDDEFGMPGRRLIH